MKVKSTARIKKLRAERTIVRLRKLRAERTRACHAFQEVFDAYWQARSQPSVKEVDVSKVRVTRDSAASAAPSPVDFICDVQNAVTFALPNAALFGKAVQTYFFNTNGLLDAKQKSYVERRVGQVFIAQKLWPTARHICT